MRENKKMMQFALLPILSLAIYFIVDTQRDSLDRLQKKSFSLSSLNAIDQIGSSTLAKRTYPQELADHIEISDSLLIDSIMTIIQNYYVDESRVESRKLMESTLKSLSEQDQVQLQIDGNRPWVLSQGPDSISFKFSSHYSYDELMRDAIRTSQFLQDHKSTSSNSHPVANGAHLFLTAMLASLDPHSNLLTPEEYRDLRQGTEGSFGGLGIVVGVQDDVLTVIKPLPKSPASRAGVAKYDRIMQIDGKSTFGTTLDDLVQYMRGEPGTKVNLYVLREGDFAPRKLFLTREIIQVDSVESKLINTDKGTIFYAYIDSFSSRTSQELRDALIKAQQDADPLAGIILDMRSNPGGLLDQAVKLADLFIDEGRILSTQGRTKEYEMAKHNLYHFDYPMVILSNGDMASASEIVAGALRDHGRALVIGEPSFGKGSVQTVFELPGEKALKLTIARYFTPKGISIQNTGIMPDIWLQPMRMGRENLNLMGEYRYRSERYLDHSLDQNKVRTAALQAEDLKAYYLVPETTGHNKSVVKDIPLEFAEKLLLELAAKEGVPLPKERLRSSYWLASNSKLLRENLKEINDMAQDWLQSKIGVTWAEDPGQSSNFDPKNLRFELETSGPLSVVKGQPAMIPWRLKNFSKEPLNRISVFVSSNHSGLATSEILIGRIEPNQEVHGIIRYDIKLEVKESPIRLRVGLAHSGWPLPKFERPLIANISESEIPKLEITMRIIQEHGGQQPGVLEAGEQARLEFQVRNSSEVIASSVDVNVVNLAGSQVKMHGLKTSLGTIRAGEVKTIRVPLQASANLSSELLQFGISVASRELLESAKAHFFVPGFPASRVSKSKVNLGSSSWMEN